MEDISYNPIAVVQRLEDEPPERRFERAVVVGAVERGGPPPGTVTAYRWDGVLPGDEEIQRAVTEAVTGVIALDNTLVVTRHFGGAARRRRGHRGGAGRPRVRRRRSATPVAQRVRRVCDARE